MRYSMCKEIKVGIVDDDRNKIIGLRANLSKKITTLSSDINDKYNDYEIIVSIIELKDIDYIINEIRNQNIDCLIIDYKLNSFSSVSYDGTELANYIKIVIPEFPFFVVTSFEEDLFSNTLFDSYQVFDYNRYTDIKEEKERDELNFKIIQQVLNYRDKMKQWKKELVEILPNAGKSVEIDDRILVLNKNITGYYSNEMLIPDGTFKALTSSKMDDFLEKIEKILDDE